MPSDTRLWLGFRVSGLGWFRGPSTSHPFNVSPSLFPLVGDRTLRRHERHLVNFALAARADHSFLLKKAIRHSTP